jgi:DNA-directed RNA polymerase specialized sigma24 family protein
MILTSATRRVTELTPSNTETKNSGVSSEAALAGILALLADEREARIEGDKAGTKTEILLAGAGLAAPEIAALMGKKPDAVRKTLQRGRS